MPEEQTFRPKDARQLCQQTASKSWCSALASRGKPRCSALNLAGKPAKWKSRKARSWYPGTLIFWAAGACPCQPGLACPSASSTGCCQLQHPQQKLNCPGEERAIPPLLHSNSAGCLGSLGQNLISFQFKTKQALLYFLCFAFFHIYEGLGFFALLLTTVLASSDLLPSNYPVFSSASPGRAQVIRKVIAGTRGHPCLRAGTQGTAPRSQSAALSCRSLSIRNSRGKSTGAMGTPTLGPSTQRKAKTRPYLKYLRLKTTYPPTFRTRGQTLSAAPNTSNELRLPAYRPNMYPPILCSKPSFLDISLNFPRKNKFNL